MDDARLRAALGYLKFRHTPRVLIFDTGYLLVDDVAEAAEDCGWKVFRLPTRKTGTGDGGFIAVLLKALVTFRPDFILTMNHLGFDRTGVLARLLERYDVPIASWFVDHPIPVLAGARENAVSNLQVFCFERDTLPWLSKEGFVDSVYLPTGSNGRFFSEHRLNHGAVAGPKSEISFVGNSWWYKARIEPSKSIRRLARKLCSDNGWHRSTATAYLAAYLTDGTREKGLATQVAMAEASMRSRQKLVNRFRELKIAVVGDPHWKQLCPGVSVSPFLDYHSQVPAFYAASTINLNITSEQMPTAVNQRVWDVPGVGGFLLTDSQLDVLEHFEDGVSVAVYSSNEDALDKARYYLGKPELRGRIAQKGMETVNHAHRLTHRLTKMYDVLKARFS